MKKSILLLAILFLSIFNCSAQYIVNRYNFGTITSDGHNPYGSLISVGNFFYGMTSGGGINNKGIIFKIKKDFTGYTKLYDFADSTGTAPYGSLIYDGTYLYGMTTSHDTSHSGIFKIRPDGTGYSKIPGALYGGGSGSLISDGTFFYGMTTDGVLFKIKPDGTGFSMLHGFNGTPDGGMYYNGNGLPSPNGFFKGSLFFDGVFLYGMTNSGGTGTCQYGCGTIFKIKPDGTGYTKLYDFLGQSDGYNPVGSLISDGTFLYGTTMWGGGANNGTIFKIKPDGTGYTVILYCGGSNDYVGFPESSLIYDGTFLYGTSRGGGVTNGQGSIFKIKPDGSWYSNMNSFPFTLPNTTDGFYPMGDLISDGSFLYGMTESGAAPGYGMIFKYQIAHPTNCIANYTTTYDSLQNNFTLNVNSITSTMAVSYHWDFGDGTTSTLSNPSHTYSVDTVYNVCMKIQTASGDTCSYCHVIGKDYLGHIYRNTGFTVNVYNTNITTDFSQTFSEEGKIEVYPNPTSGVFHVSSSKYKVVSIGVYNLLGEKVYQSESTNPKAEIDLSSQPNGIYFIKIKTEQGVASKKIIINR